MEKLASIGNTVWSKIIYVAKIIVRALFGKTMEEPQIEKASKVMAAAMVLLAGVILFPKRGWVILQAIGIVIDFTILGFATRYAMRLFKKAKMRVNEAVTAEKEFNDIH